MNILVTGASGYIGNKLAHTLAHQGRRVHALVRSDAAKALLQHPNITLFKGDILHPESLAAAMRGCRQVYHTAAKAGAWVRTPSDFYAVNGTGTRNVLHTALQCGVEKLVFTSSCGVIGPTDNEPLHEDHIRTTGFTMHYDRSKKEAENLVLEYAQRGRHAVVVCPSKVFGPGNTSHSLTANALIHGFLKKKMGFIPAPGTYTVCLAFIDDVVRGHVLAMEKGRSGERYILGGTNISYYQFFDRIRMLSSTNARILTVPKRLSKAFAYLQELNHRVTGAAVRFDVKSVNYLYSNYTFSSNKAIQELGYPITPLDTALQATIRFLNGDTQQYVMYPAAVFENVPAA